MTPVEINIAVDLTPLVPISFVICACVAFVAILRYGSPDVTTTGGDPPRS